MYFMMLFITISLFFMNSWISVFMVMMLIFIMTMINLNQFFTYSVLYLFSFSSINNLLIFLSVMLCVLAIISTPDNKKKFFFMSISSLMFFLLLFFSVSNMILFYIFFEATLIPTLLLVSYWGYQPERLQAGSYMMLYTVTASLPLLIVLLYVSVEQNNMMMIFPMKFYSNFMVMMVYSAFLVKLPMYSVHLWLPKAHVEASLAGSMLLAGILLKLGGYGLIQMNMLFDIAGDKTTVLLSIISFSFWGGFLASFLSLKQIDMKSFVAYSSVSHMSLVILGILSDSTWGMFSAVITMFAHGFCSSALFCLTYFTYTKFYSRSIMHISGIISVYPKMSFLWFIFCCANMAAPPSLNLLGEMFVAPVVNSLSSIFLVLMGIMVFVSGFYNMYLYTVMNHGQSSMYSSPSSPMKSYQMMAMLSHFLPMLFLLKMDLFM